MIPAAALENKRILVAGATGLVGSAIVRALLAAAPTLQVTGAHRSRAGAFVHDARVTYVAADLTTRDGCAWAASGCHMAILAAAATGGAAQARREPWHQVTGNAVMDSLLLDALNAAGIRRAVYISSATVYQEHDGFIAEDQLDWNTDPHRAYLGVGWTKRYLEKQCAFWHQATGMEIVIARAANVYGPWAQFSPANSNFIAALIRKAVDCQDPFEVWGSLDVTRDVLYTEDFADVIVRMLASDIVFDVFNVGSGRLARVGDVLDLALKWAGHRPGEIRRLDQGPTTIASRGLDCGKAKRMFGWAPRTGLDEGIGRTVQWWREHKDVWTR
jgi:GDP-L-fucose synthase